MSLPAATVAPFAPHARSINKLIMEISCLGCSTLVKPQKCSSIDKTDSFDVGLYTLGINIQVTASV